MPMRAHSTVTLPATVARSRERAGVRFLDSFAAQIPNPHTRRAYTSAALEFLAWLETLRVTSLAQVESTHVVTWIELERQTKSAPTVKLRLAAIRHLFDWLVTGHIVDVNPAAAVRGPRHVVRAGNTPLLEPAEVRHLLDTIDVSTPAGLRDRALIGLMVYSLARIGAALAMKVEDVYFENRRLWVRLHEKRGKRHAMPCHHALEEFLHAYLEGAGIGNDLKGPLFRTIGRGTGKLTRTSLPQANAHAMIRRRAAAAGIKTLIGNHSLRATGITTYLRNGGTLEMAAAMANHTCVRSTQLYLQRSREMSFAEVERIAFWKER